MIEWTRLRLVTPPPAGPSGLIVSVADAMAQCRVTPGGLINETAWFERTIRAAQRRIDGPRGAGVALLTATWRMSLDRWPDEYAIIPLGPTQSIESITFQDTAYNVVTLDPSQYRYDLDQDPVLIVRTINVAWPELGIVPGAVKITFKAGFGDTAADVPEDLQHAVLLLVSHWYNHRDAVVGVDNRDSSAELPLGVQPIIDRYSAVSIA